MDEEYTLSESDPEEFQFGIKTPSEVDAEDAEDETPFASIHSISKERGPIFSAWRLYIPPEPVFRSSSAQSWWSASSPLASLSLEPTLTRISSINCSNSTIGQSPTPVSTTHTSIKMKQSPQHGWKPYKPATKCYKHNWNKPWPESNITYRRTMNSLKESQDR